MSEQHNTFGEKPQWLKDIVDAPDTGIDYNCDNRRCYICGNPILPYSAICCQETGDRWVQPQPSATRADPPSLGGSDDMEGDASMANNEEERFAQLRYFFWRYLDWRQRIKVLVDADVLPDTANRPVSQTMERLALNSARTQGKLGQVWEAVMKVVPDDKREQNPFESANKKD